MTWETRNGRGRYYTKSRRINGRIQREYLGCGLVAELAAEADAAERQVREAQAAALRDEKAKLMDLDATVAEASQLAELLAQACLLNAGLHNHKGQWRRRRVQQD